MTHINSGAFNPAPPTHLSPHGHNASLEVWDWSMYMYAWELDSTRRVRRARAVEFLFWVSYPLVGCNAKNLTKTQENLRTDYCHKDSWSGTLHDDRNSEETEASSCCTGLAIQDSVRRCFERSRSKAQTPATSRFKKAQATSM